MSLTSAAFVICTALGAIELTGIDLGGGHIAIAFDGTLGDWVRDNGEVKVYLIDDREFKGKEEFIADLSKPYVCGEFGTFPPFNKFHRKPSSDPSTDSS